MAAELPYASDPTHKPAAVSRATGVAVLVYLTLSLASSVRRVRQDENHCVGVAFLVFVHLNLALLFCALRSVAVAPQGSPAHGRATLAQWLLTTTLTDAFVWRVEAVLVLPLRFAVAAWVVAAAVQAGGFYFLFLHDDKKPSAGSLVMRHCESDG